MGRQGAVADLLGGQEQRVGAEHGAGGRRRLLHAHHSHQPGAAAAAVGHQPRPPPGRADRRLARRLAPRVSILYKTACGFVLHAAGAAGND